MAAKCILIKAQSTTDRWPRLHPNAKIILKGLRRRFKRAGGSFDWRFRKGVIYIGIWGVNPELVSQTVLEWRKAIAEGGDPTAVEWEKGATWPWSLPTKRSARQAGAGHPPIGGNAAAAPVP